MCLIFRNVLDTTEAVQELIRMWRNNDKVRSHMFSDHLVSKEEHATWLASLPNSQLQKAWVVFSHATPIAVVNLQKISLSNKRTDWGFYVDPEKSRPGMGAKVLYAFLYRIFEEWNYEKVNAVVLSNNMPVVKLHKKFGFVEEGIRREHILRNEQKMDCYFLGLCKTEWLPVRGKYEILLGS